jgi:hypothetical protein
MDIDDDKLTQMECEEEEECLHVEEARKHSEERVRRIAEAKAMKRVREEAERKKHEATEKEEAECKQHEATEKGEVEWKARKEVEKREVERRAC